MKQEVVLRLQNEDGEWETYTRPLGKRWHITVDDNGMTVIVEDTEHEDG